MKRPCLEDLAMAAEWLRCNEGDGGESESCSRVATWLDTYSRESAERAAAREVGCSVKYLRKYMKHDRLADPADLKGSKAS